MNALIFFFFTFLVAPICSSGFGHFFLIYCFACKTDSMHVLLVKHAWNLIQSGAYLKQ